MPDLIYLDNNASTRPLDEVAAAMQPYLRDEYGNPSSVHRFGQRARFAVESARAEVAELLAASPGEIVFTSGGTESINLALQGALAGLPPDRPLVVSASDHRAVLATAKRLEQYGRPVCVVGVDENGALRADEFEAALARRPGVVSLTAANNETGVVWDITALTRIAHGAGALVHVDAVQAVGRLSVDSNCAHRPVAGATNLGPLVPWSLGPSVPVRAWDADLVSVSAHKFHGPKGVGALYVREGTPLAPILTGGAQERQRRGGTENAPGIVGMGVAARLAAANDNAAVERVAHLRDRLERGLVETTLPPSRATTLRECSSSRATTVRECSPSRATTVKECFLKATGRDEEVSGRTLGPLALARVVAGGAARLCNTSCIIFEGASAEKLLLALSEAGVCASSGSACSSGSLEPSHVLRAMGFSDAHARAAIRFSLSQFTTADEIDRVVSLLPALLARSGAPVSTKT